MKRSYYFVPVILALMSSLAASENIQGTELDALTEIKPTALVPLPGSFNGKIYFVEYAQVTWEVANATCVENNMELVSVESTAEHNHLRDALSSGYYWTSAVDMQRFSWPNGNPVPLGIAARPADRNCGMIFGRSGGYLYVDRCSSNGQTLCESRV